MYHKSLSYDAAQEAVIAKLEEMKQDNATVAAMQSALRGYLLDESLFKSSERQRLIKAVNTALETTWAMKNITRAAKKDVDTLFTREWPDPIKHVDVLEGTANVTLPVSQPTATEANETTTTETVSGDTTMQINDLAAERLQTTTTTVVELPLNATAASAQSTADADDKTVFIKDLTDNGVNTPALQLQLFTTFFTNHPNEALQLAYTKLLTSASPAEAFYDAVISKDPEASKLFLALLNTLKPTTATVTTTTDTRAWYSFTGDRDGTVRGGWIAALSAAVSAGLAIAHKGELTLGSGLGAAAGIAGSFVAAEMLSKHIDSDFGNYVAAGSLGLALGAGGVMAGNRLGALMATGGQPTMALPTILVQAPAEQQ